MTSTTPPKRRYLVEPLETTSTSYRRQPSNRSDASPSPSNDSDSTSSSMAAVAQPSLLMTPAKDSVTRSYRDDTQHIKNTRGMDMSMSLATGHATLNGTDGATDASGGVSTTTTQHKARRRFTPEPLETSSRSSKKEHDAETPTSPPAKRKFAPEPIETTAKSSKSKDAPRGEEVPRRPRRKFAVEPVETTVISSKDREPKIDGLEKGARPKRRFAVEPVETSTRTSKGKEAESETTIKPRRKFAVEPVETSTSTSSSRKKKTDPITDNDNQDQETPSRASSSGRKFSPELVATAKASYRKKPNVESAIPKWLKAEVADDEGSWSAPETHESRFSAANLAKKARADPRRHSYSIPDLPIIQSDSSEEDESVKPTRPGTLSHMNSRDHNTPRLSNSKHRQNHEQHLRDLKTLREQAVAAYGSQEDRIQFGHYGGDSDDEDHHMSLGRLKIEDGADPQLFRRNSYDDIHLVGEDMRRHQEQLEAAKRGLQEDTAGISRFSAAALAARHHINLHHPAGVSYTTKRDVERKQKEDDSEMAKMRKAASPPMAGNDIAFPYSNSPRMTRCDPDQAPRPRRRNSEDEEEHDIGIEELWSAHITPAKQDAPTGLWGGMCQKDESHDARPGTPLRSGLQTPAFERSNPFGPRTPGGHGSKTPRKGPMWTGSAFIPLTPPRSRNEMGKGMDSFAAALDQKLSLEQQIDKEFPPRVITQIYNYLSLGYPSIARPFDGELAKISRISIVELRKGDRSVTGTMKGHIGAPEGEGDYEEDDDGRVKACRRWEALRLYVREWARQSPNFAVERGLPLVGTGMWGNNAPVRKGSWGF